MFSTFPKYFRNAVTRISEEGFICICTFWTKKEYVSDILTPENRKKVLQDKRIPKRDRIALISTYFGAGFFKISWNVFKKIKYKQ